MSNIAKRRKNAAGRRLRRLRRLATWAAAGAAVYGLLIRPWHLKWGATDTEARVPLPGDTLVPHPRSQSTRAITIGASAEQVWPWLVQIGYQRGGWYSYDRLEAMAGVADFREGHSTRRILPELQNLKVGDVIRAAPEPYVSFRVVTLEPARVLALYSRLNPFTGVMLKPGDLSDISLDASWVFVLEPLDEKTTRLIVRFRADYQPPFLVMPAVWTVLEPVTFLMEQKMLRGIKERAEVE